MAEGGHNEDGSGPMDLGPEFHDRLWTEIEREVRAPAVRVRSRYVLPDRRRAWSAAAAVLVVLVGGGVLLTRHHRGDGRVVSSVPSTSMVSATTSASAAAPTAAPSSSGASARLSDECIWLPSYRGHDGAGGKSMNVIDLTNIGMGRCETTTVQSVTAALVDGTQVTATQGGAFPVSPAPATSATGERISIILTTLNAIENCGAVSSQPVTQITIHFTGGVSTSVLLGTAIETACDFAYLIGGPTE